MTPEELSMIAGVVLSLVFSYAPGLKDWFDSIQPDQRRLVMLAALFVTTAGIFGGGCAGLWAVFACTWAGAWQAVQLFIFAAIANQTAYQLSPGVKARRLKFDEI